MQTSPSLCFVPVGYLVHQRQVLLIFHRKYQMWIAPGGHLEPGETLNDALIREIKEELNLQIQFLHTSDIPKQGNIIRQLAVPFYVDLHQAGTHHHYAFYYLCKPTNLPDLKASNKEIQQLRWFDQQQLLESKDLPIHTQNIALKALQLASNQ
jgi:ADP-ribose pyrophosphatase YjhB (NUDIX family)